MINSMGFTGRAALLSSAGLFALGMAAPAFADTAAQPQPKPQGQTEALPREPHNSTGCVPASDIPDSSSALPA